MHRVQISTMFLSTLIACKNIDMAILKHVLTQPGLSVICVLVTRMSPTKMAEPMPFGMLTCMGPWNHVLGGGTYWRHMANTIVRLKDSCSVVIWADTAITVATCSSSSSCCCHTCDHVSADFNSS